MATEKTEEIHLKAGERFKIKVRTTAKIIFNVRNIEATVCKTPAKVVENDAVFIFNPRL